MGKMNKKVNLGVLGMNSQDLKGVPIMDTTITHRLHHGLHEHNYLHHRLHHH
jgi:hypothetical protein